MRRSDPFGLLVRFEVENGTDVTRIEAGLEDGEDVLGATVDVGGRPGGPFYRGLVWKPVVNGTWPLVLRAFVGTTQVAMTRCVPGVTVTF